MHLAGCQRARESTEIEIWPIDPLHWKTERLVVETLLNVEALQLLEQRGAVVPAHPVRSCSDVLTEARGNRNGRNRAEAQRLREPQIVAHNVVKALAREIDEIDF